MTTFIMLTRLASSALESPPGLEDLEKQVMARVREECPGVEWRGSYAILGPCDYLDIFDAPDTDTAMKVAAMVRTFGHASTEVWPATKWEHFKELIRELPARRAT